MIFLENTTQFAPAIERLKEIADAISTRDIELILCDDDAIKELNRQYRRLDKATDVLSFPLAGDHDHLPLGTVVISTDHALQKAGELGHSIDDEIALLFIHGVLHLAGYDHETDNGEMREKEHKIIRAFGLPESLIVRSGNNDDN